MLKTGEYQNEDLDQNPAPFHVRPRFHLRRLGCQSGNEVGFLQDQSQSGGIGGQGNPVLREWRVHGNPALSLSSLTPSEIIMKTSLKTKTIQEETHELTREDMEDMLIKSLGIKRASGIAVSIDFDVSPMGHTALLRGCTIKTRKETVVNHP